MMTKGELILQRKDLLMECDELHEVYARTGNAQVMVKIKDNEEKVKMIEETLHTFVKSV